MVGFRTDFVALLIKPPPVFDSCRIPAWLLRRLGLWIPVVLKWRCNRQLPATPNPNSIFSEACNEVNFKTSCDHPDENGFKQNKLYRPQMKVSYSFLYPLSRLPNRKGTGEQATTSSDTFPIFESSQRSPEWLLPRLLHKSHKNAKLLLTYPVRVTQRNHAHKEF